MEKLGDADAAFARFDHDEFLDEETRALDDGTRVVELSNGLVERQTFSLLGPTGP